MVLATPATQVPEVREQRRCYMSEHFKKLGGFTINRDVINKNLVVRQYLKEYVRALQGTRWIHDQQN